MNTVRLYERLGWIAPALRSKCGYRLFTAEHRRQMVFARLALGGAWSGRSIRHSAIHLVRTGARGDWVSTLVEARAHLVVIRGERQRAERAASVVDLWAKGRRGQGAGGVADPPAVRERARGAIERLRAAVVPHAIHGSVPEDEGPVRQELLSGIKNPEQFRSLRHHLRAFPDFELTAEDYETAAEFFNLCRGKGVQGSNTDFLICSVAARYHLPIFTTDGDFSLFQTHLPITLHCPRIQVNSK